MNSLMQQALIAYRAGVWNEWYAELSDEQRRQLRTETEVAVKPIVVAFAPIGESFRNLGQDIVNGLASAFEVKPA